jgi:TrmH family RNA methyltransferase
MIEYEITSPSNDRIKRLIRLRERRHRDSEGVFVVEGERLFNRALAAGLTPVEVFHDPTQVEVESIPTVSTSSLALDKASYRRESEGLIAVFPQISLTLDSIGLSRHTLVLMAEGIEKPGNLGAMLRSADAVGADAFVAIDSLTDPFNPNAIRASTGALFSVPVAMTDLDSCLAWLHEAGVTLLAASPERGEDYWSIDMTGPTALLVGAEAPGLSTAARAAVNTLVRIPMLGDTDSLNASVSLALLAYEALRQRGSDQDSVST